MSAGAGRQPVRRAPHLHAIIVVLILPGLVAAARARADAIVVVRAMQATTVTEIFIEAGRVRVEMEIGVPDFEAFRNVLPDEILERLGREPAPLADRLPRFFAEDWVIRADGAPLAGGRVTGIDLRSRIRRDEITGEALPAVTNQEEPVVALDLAWPLPDRPSTISIAPPVGGEDARVTANIGFVAYHEGVAMNDFRYLGTEVTADLDWSDPWYSRFRHRNLRRRYDAPLSGFLYIDPFEVRKEIIVRPKDLQAWIDLGLEGKTVIPAAEQAAIKEQVGRFLMERNPVLIDGRVVEPILDRIHFVRRTLRTTGVIDPPEDLPLVSATLGVIIVYPITSLPDLVTMDWELFTPRIQRIPAVATDEAGGLPSFLTPDDPVLEWKNFLRFPSSTALVSLAPPPAPARLRVSLVSLVALLAGAVITIGGLRAGGAWSGRRIAACAIALVVALAGWPFQRVDLANPLAADGTVSEADAATITTGLLRNVYRAFDYRGESTIYDTLERSASGDLLTDIYLETRRALELRNQGGARAKVTDVEMLAAEVTNLEDEVGFVAACTWDVAGSVGHWGHIHQRRNRYLAVLTVRPVDGAWKITDLELLGEERL